MAYLWHPALMLLPINCFMKIKSKLTGLEQTVTDKTFEAMEALKPGLHKKLADDVETPPEAAETDHKQAIPAAEKNKGKTVLPAGAPLSPNSTPE